MKRPSASTSYSASTSTHTITITSANGMAKVHPRVQHVKAGDEIVFEVDGFDEGSLFFFVPSLFDRLHASIPGNALTVQPARKGAYPYFAVVISRERNEELVAEGNSMPVFVME